MMPDSADKAQDKTERAWTRYERERSAAGVPTLGPATCACGERINIERRRAGRTNCTDCAVTAAHVGRLYPHRHR